LDWIWISKINWNWKSNPRSASCLIELLSLSKDFVFLPEGLLSKIEAHQKEKKKSATKRKRQEEDNQWPKLRIVTTKTDYILFFELGGINPNAEHPKFVWRKDNRTWTFTGTRSFEIEKSQVEYSEIKDGPFFRTGIFPPEVNVEGTMTKEIVYGIHKISLPFFTKEMCGDVEEQNQDE